MRLADWANLSIVVQGVLLPLSLFILIWQLRQQTKLTRAANAQSLVEIASPFNLALVQDPAMAELWRDGSASFAKMDSTLQSRYVNMLLWWILLHENIHNQWRQGLIDADVYRSWEKDLEFFLSRHDMSGRWPKMKAYYHADFAEHVATILETQRREREAAAAKGDV
jgi:hypothetical protein